MSPRDSISLLSKNVANAGTPGYHRQSLNVVDYDTGGASYVRDAGTVRAFNSSLQTYYTRQVSDTSTSGVQASYLDQLQTYLGKPGSAGSLDTIFGDLQNAMQSLATSPDDFTARAQMLDKAQNMVATLNQLSGAVQDMRQQTEGQMATDVGQLNSMLKSLAEVNSRVLNAGTAEDARASLLDQRDRLVSSIAEMVDVQVDYRSDGSVALMTRSGVGLLDGGVSTFNFESAGNLAATSQYDRDASQSKVGALTLTTPSGLTINLVGTGVIQGGELGGLLTLRDQTLVTAQDQLDEIASGLALAFSTVQTPGTVATAGAATGFDLDLTGLQKGNDLVFSYHQGSTDIPVRLVNSTQPTDYLDASGQRVIGVDLSNPANAAALLNSKLPGLAISSSGPNNLRIMDDGAANTTDVNFAVVRRTSSGLQGDGSALSLFVDQGNTAFTNNLDGNTPQKLGFASRIAINPAVLLDNTLLVKSTTGTASGDDTRPKFLLNQLNNMQFVSGGDPKQNAGKFQLTGNLSQIVGQVINYQGSTISTAIAQRDNRQLALDTVVQQMDSEYGVNLDEEMARLTQLQNAYAANARIVSVVQELLDSLLQSV
ncbi:flagellar hook-associated protein FlgK [Devosia algicola]|uniref:Flagellar hook-associated protein 1 n=1 Tax=Devosia algicola TaxID=3026418 RepID=A0ABY7YR84_9HYPH|nr:flagellar hook-associated protein FlgK [Devosia algicola]WDR03769.1 flagellar hook-associated protein FlgK [Devosia algicola]